MIEIWEPEMIEQESDRQTFAKFQQIEWVEHMRNDSSQIALVRDRVMKLPHNERAVIYLRFWEGLEPFEIASILNLTTKFTNLLIKRALAILACELESLTKSHNKRATAA